MGRVVVGVDGSAASSGALRWAADEAERSRAELHVVSVWDIPHGWEGADLVVGDLRRDLEQLAQETVDDAVDAARSQVRSDVEVRGEVACGSPVKLLLDAGRSAELLVVGNIGHTPVSGLLLGSVADAVVRHATCPVAVVPMERRGASS